MSHQTPLIPPPPPLPPPPPSSDTESEIIAPSSSDHALRSLISTTLTTTKQALSQTRASKIRSNLLKHEACLSKSHRHSTYQTSLNHASDALNALPKLATDTVPMPKNRSKPPNGRAWIRVQTNMSFPDAYSHSFYVPYLGESDACLKAANSLARDLLTQKQKDAADDSDVEDGLEFGGGDGEEEVETGVDGPSGKKMTVRKVANEIWDRAAKRVALKKILDQVGSDQFDAIKGVVSEVFGLGNIKIVEAYHRNIVARMCAIDGIDKDMKDKKKGQELMLKAARGGIVTSPAGIMKSESVKVFFCRQCYTFLCTLHGQMGEARPAVSPFDASRKDVLENKNVEEVELACEDREGRHCWHLGTPESYVMEKWASDIKEKKSLWKNVEPVLRELFESFGHDSCRISSLLRVAIPECQEDAAFTCQKVGYLLKELFPKGENEVRIRKRLSNHSKRKKGKWKTHRTPQEQNSEIPGRRLDYKPCHHEGACTPSNCSCKQKGVLCEKFCGCFTPAYQDARAQVFCSNMHRGCTCRGACQSKACVCFSMNRECDPDMCRSCHVYKEGPLPDPKNWSCQNNGLRMKKRQRVVAGHSEIHGWGVFAPGFIRKNDIIGEYVGEVISDDEAECRGRVYDEVTYSFLFTTTEQYALDSTHIGNKLRYCNHSNTPNCEPRVMRVGGDIRVGLYAKRDIEPNEELFFNYGYNENGPSWAMADKSTKSKSKGSHSGKRKMESDGDSNDMELEILPVSSRRQRAMAALSQLAVKNDPVEVASNTAKKSEKDARGLGLEGNGIANEPKRRARGRFAGAPAALRKCHTSSTPQVSDEVASDVINVDAESLQAVRREVMVKEERQNANDVAGRELTLKQSPREECRSDWRNGKEAESANLLRTQSPLHNAVKSTVGRSVLLGTLKRASMGAAGVESAGQSYSTANCQGNHASPAAELDSTGIEENAQPSLKDGGGVRGATDGNILSGKASTHRVPGSGDGWGAQSRKREHPRSMQQDDITVDEKVPAQNAGTGKRPPTKQSSDKTTGSCKPEAKISRTLSDESDSDSEEVSRARKHSRIQAVKGESSFYGKRDASEAGKSPQKHGVNGGDMPERAGKRLRLRNTWSYDKDEKLSKKAKDSNVMTPPRRPKSNSKTAMSPQMTNGRSGSKGANSGREATARVRYAIHLSPARLSYGCGERSQEGEKKRERKRDSSNLVVEDLKEKFVARKEPGRRGASRGKSSVQNTEATKAVGLHLQFMLPLPSLGPTSMIPVVNPRDTPSPSHIPTGPSENKTQSQVHEKYPGELSLRAFQIDIFQCHMDWSHRARTCTVEEVTQYQYRREDVLRLDAYGTGRVKEYFAAVWDPYFLPPALMEDRCVQYFVSGKPGSLSILDGLHHANLDARNLCLQHDRFLNWIEWLAVTKTSQSLSRSVFVRKGELKVSEEVYPLKFHLFPRILSQFLVASSLTICNPSILAYFSDWYLHFHEEGRQRFETDFEIECLHMTFFFIMYDFYHSNIPFRYPRALIERILSILCKVAEYSGTGKTLVRPKFSGLLGTKKMCWQEWVHLLNDATQMKSPLFSSSVWVSEYSFLCFCGIHLISLYFYQHLIRVEGLWRYFGSPFFHSVQSSLEQVPVVFDPPVFTVYRFLLEKYPAAKRVVIFSRFSGNFCLKDLLDSFIGVVEDMEKHQQEADGNKARPNRVRIGNNLSTKSLQESEGRITTSTSRLSVAEQETGGFDTSFNQWKEEMAQLREKKKHLLSYNGGLQMILTDG